MMGWQGRLDPCLPLSSDERIERYEMEGRHSEGVRVLGQQGRPGPGARVQSTWKDDLQSLSFSSSEWPTVISCQ